MENEGFPHSPAPICCTFGEELKVQLGSPPGPEKSMQGTLAFQYLALEAENGHPFTPTQFNWHVLSTCCLPGDVLESSVHRL